MTGEWMSSAWSAKPKPWLQQIVRNTSLYAIIPESAAGAAQRDRRQQCATPHWRNLLAAHFQFDTSATLFFNNKSFAVKRDHARTVCDHRSLTDAMPAWPVSVSRQKLCATLTRSDSSAREGLPEKNICVHTRKSARQEPPVPALFAQS
jgi:hypothetical protein